MQLRTFPGLWARRTSTLAIGTSATNVGLDIDVTPGIYQIRAVLPLVNVGSPTNTNVDLAGPTADWVIGSFTRWTSGLAAAAAYDNAFPLTTSAAAAQAGNIMHILSADMRLTASGTLALTMTRVGGTSQTLQVGAYMYALRIA